MSQAIQEATNAATYTPRIDFYQPAIYVASLSDYNGGILHGRWIACEYGADHVWDEVQAMLAESPYQKQYGDIAEEWAIHDYSGFYGVSISESADFDKLCELAEDISEHGEAYAAYCENVGNWDVSGFEDAYCGTYGSELDYAYELADELINAESAPEFLTRYFDYEAFCRDLFINDCFSERVADGVAVFRHI